MGRATKTEPTKRVNIAVAPDTDVAIRRVMIGTSSPSKSEAVAKAVAFYEQALRYAADGGGVFVRDGHGVDKFVEFRQKVPS